MSDRAPAARIATLRSRIGFSPESVSSEYERGLRPSAVSVLLYPLENELHILLTKRSTHVAHHKGQIAFPGGSWEAADPSLRDTALRETEEELGIPRTTIHLFGELPGTTTPTGFHITPYVGYLEGSLTYRLNPSEIEAVISVPLSTFHSQAATARPLLTALSGTSTPCYLYHGNLIWGATGRIIRQLLAVFEV